MKLTNKQCPCLTLDIEVQTLATLQTHHVTHDIPVVVISRKVWSEYAEPKIPDPDVTIELPALKILRTVIESMHNMAGEIILHANSEGAIQHDSDSETESQINERATETCYCKVDAKKLSIFLTVEQVSHSLALCSIVHKKLIVLCLHTHENVKLKCFIPGIVY
ncbi:Checkpoint protein HUS1 [Eumeta japonica]|uniref:Checkpoint protein HUS1 n=1 Tax=Eumeta variegata TaxID=151549 RepID=A0A4C1VGD7_EUMVA|nr:Checkpoint protein HUS1 [Eumeta japonica]